MDYQIKWTSSDGETLRENEMSSRILAEMMGSLFSLEPGDRILEIGGGNGFFAQEAVRLGYDVTVLDCEEADLDPSVHFIQADWNEIEENDPALQEKYKVIVSNFSNAVQEVESLRKMNHTSTDWCLLNRFLVYTEPMFDRFCRALDLKEKPVYPKLKKDYVDLNTNSTFAGHFAKVYFSDYHWETLWAPKDAAQRFLDWYFAGKEIPEGVAEAAVRAAKDMAENGKVLDEVKVHVAHVHWNVNQI